MQLIDVCVCESGSRIDCVYINIDQIVSVCPVSENRCNVYVQGSPDAPFPNVRESAGDFIDRLYQEATG
jgi:hypothetical protein